MSNLSIIAINTHTHFEDCSMLLFLFFWHGFLLLETNLGPTYMSEKLVEEVYHLRKKDYLYKETSTGELATHYTHLVDKNHGAAIRTYRAEQELKSKLPRAFWE